MRHVLRQGARGFHPFLAVVIGVGLGVVRGKELISSFDAQTGLPTWGREVWVGGMSAIMLVLAVLSMAALVLLAFASKPVGGDYNSVFGGSMLSKVFTSAGGLLLVAAAAADCAAGATTQLSRLILALLSAFAGVTLIASLSSRTSVALRNFCTLVAPSFACYLLIIVYRDRTSNPIIWSYVYDMAAVAIASVMFFQNAAFAFDAARPKAALAASLCTTAAGICVTTAAIIYAVFCGEAPNGDAPMVAYTAAMSICAVGSSFAHTRRG